jgi:hypothetical protein
MVPGTGVDPRHCQSLDARSCPGCSRAWRRRECRVVVSGSEALAAVTGAFERREATAFGGWWSGVAINAIVPL